MGKSSRWQFSECSWRDNECMEIHIDYRGISTDFASLKDYEDYRLPSIQNDPKREQRLSKCSMNKITTDMLSKKCNAWLSIVWGRTQQIINMKLEVRTELELLFYYILAV